MSTRAKMMSKLRKLSDVKTFPPEGSYVPDPDIDSTASSRDEYSIEEGSMTLEQAERLVRKSKMRNAFD